MQGFIEERTATINRIRGLIADFNYSDSGIISPVAVASRRVRIGVL